MRLTPFAAKWATFLLTLNGEFETHSLLLQHLKAHSGECLNIYSRIPQIALSSPELAKRLLLHFHKQPSYLNILLKSVWNMLERPSLPEASRIFFTEVWEMLLKTLSAEKFSQQQPSHQESLANLAQLIATLEQKDFFLFKILIDIIYAHSEIKKCHQKWVAMVVANSLCTIRSTEQQVIFLISFLPYLNRPHP